jgi:hypothetical protein
VHVVLGLAARELVEHKMVHHVHAGSDPAEEDLEAEPEAQHERGVRAAGAVVGDAARSQQDQRPHVSARDLVGETGPVVPGVDVAVSEAAFEVEAADEGAAPSALLLAGSDADAGDAPAQARLELVPGRELQVGLDGQAVLDPARVACAEERGGAERGVRSDRDRHREGGQVDAAEAAAASGHHGAEGRRAAADVDRGLARARDVEQRDAAEDDELVG